MNAERKREAMNAAARQRWKLIQQRGGKFALVDGKLRVSGIRFHSDQVWCDRYRSAIEKIKQAEQKREQQAGERRTATTTLAAEQFSQVGLVHVRSQSGQMIVSHRLGDQFAERILSGEISVEQAIELERRHRDTLAAMARNLRPVAWRR
jgi:hypothetical protein